MRIASTAMILLMLAGAAMAGVSNVTLSEVGDSGISGTATIITGQYAGTTPRTRVEFDARLNKMPSADMVYEAWLIDNESGMKQSLGILDGSMLSAGMTMRSFKAGSPWDVIAISSEPADDMNPMPAKIVAQGNLPGTMVSSADWATMAVMPANDMFQQQLAMQRWNVTSDQFATLRMDGLMYSDINLVLNIAARCGRTPMDVATDYMMWGGDLNKLASSCNMTVAQLLTPMPMVAVAGSIQEYTPGTTMAIPNYYLMRPNGQMVVSRDDWMRYRRAGYTWEQVAMAANISQRTGVSVSHILKMNKVQGLGFSQIALNYGLRPTEVMDVSQWPWERGGGMETIVPVTPKPMPSSTMHETGEGENY